MNIRFENASPTQVAADAVVLGVYEGAPLPAAAAEFDRASAAPGSAGALTRLLEARELQGKAGELAVLLAPRGARALHVAAVGLGPREKLDRGGAFRAAAAASKKLADKQRGEVAFFLADGWSPELTESGVCGAMVGCQGQDLYRQEKNLRPFHQLLWRGGDPAAGARGRVLGEAVNLTRRLVNEPPNEMYPASFALAAQQVADECGMQCEVWDERRLAEERCGALLAVGQASDRPPRLVVLSHAGGSPGQAPLALVGKGVTFDSGGLSIKPTDGMKTMKCDMAGAATVLGAMRAIAQLQLPLNVIGLCGLVENLLSGRSYKLGDVLRSRAGKTIEVLNTDAEGRLVLADVLDVALERGANRIVDLATLTGACVVALGNDVAGLMTNNQPWADQVLAAAQACGELTWQLPMFSEFDEQIKSDVADIKNVGAGRWGGAITAAKFLQQFVRDTPWSHLDIAGPAFLETAKPWLDAGGSGAYVRALVELARNRASAG